MKLIITLSLALLLGAAPCTEAVSASLPETTFAAAKPKKEIRKVEFATNMNCHNCVKKVTENVSYAKGVKDLEVSLEKQRICVSYDASKTSEKELAELIRKLGYKAEPVKAEQEKK